MTNSTQPRTFVRAINTLLAVAFGVFVLANYWPTVKVFDLSRADLQLQGEWIGGHAKRITAVTPGGVADRAGLKAGDVLEFDPGRDADWVLAGYRQMPEGFRAALPVRHADGSRAVVTLAPERVAYLTTLNDRLALLARLTSLTLLVLVGVFVVWARPCVMTWSMYLAMVSVAPFRVWAPYHLAFNAGIGFSPVALVIASTWGWAIALVPFALCFPRDTLVDWPRWKQWLGLTSALALVAGLAAGLYAQPFERGEGQTSMPWISASVLPVIVVLLSTAAFVRTYRRSNEADRARLKWVIIGFSVANLAVVVGFLVVFVAPRSIAASALSGTAITPLHWVFALSAVITTISLGYGVFRQRVIDVQFAFSRTLVYGAVTTLALVFLAAVHWLLGRLIEQSGLAIGLEGIAAIGLGLVLHRTSHGITLLVDRVLFRKHHQAEERLRRVTAALPFANDERAIAEALVTEPVRNLNLASAALFYRDTPDGSLKRVLAQGWSNEHLTSLEADTLLVRYLQAEHEPLKLDDPHLLPARIPGGAELPVLAIPIVNQHVLAAVVLYGAHVNHTLLDPDEIELLHALARAAATSHSQVRIATLARDNASLTRETEMQKARNAQLEASLRVFAQERSVGEQGRPA